MTASLSLQVVDHARYLLLLLWVGHIGIALDSLLRLILVPALLLVSLLGLCYKQKVEKGEKDIQCGNQPSTALQVGSRPSTSSRWCWNRQRLNSRREGALHCSLRSPQFQSFSRLLEWGPCPRKQ